MLRYLTILVILPAVILGGFVPANICRNGGPVPTWAAIEGCDMTQCAVVNGQNVTLSGGLLATLDSNELKTSIVASTLLLDITLDLPEDVVNGCNAFTPSCPIVAGNEYTLETSFRAYNSLVIIEASATVELTIKNENDQVVMCVSTPVLLVP